MTSLETTLTQQFSYSKCSEEISIDKLLTALGTVLLTSGTGGILEGSSLFALFFFSVNKRIQAEQCKVLAQC